MEANTGHWPGKQMSQLHTFTSSSSSAPSNQIPQTHAQFSKRKPVAPPHTCPISILHRGSSPQFFPPAPRFISASNSSRHSFGSRSSFLPGNKVVSLQILTTTSTLPSQVPQSQPQLSSRPLALLVLFHHSLSPFPEDQLSRTWYNTLCFSLLPSSAPWSIPVCKPLIPIHRNILHLEP